MLRLDYLLEGKMPSDPVRIIDVGADISIPEFIDDAWNVNNPRAVKLPGVLTTLLSTTIITNDGSVNRTPVTGLDVFTMASFLMTLAGKNMDANTTLDVYIQYSPDGGITWDDLYHWPQITNGAIGNGKYVTFLMPTTIANQPYYHAVTDGSLAADTMRNILFCDRLRVKTVAANFAGGDTITLELSAYLQ